MNLLWILIIVAALLVALVIYVKKAIRTTDSDIENILNQWLKGVLDSNEWDYFISVKFKNPIHESIRLEAVEIWVSGSPYLEEQQTDPNKLSESGREKVKGLLEKLHSDGST